MLFPPAAMDSIVFVLPLLARRRRERQHSLVFKPVSGGGQGTATCDATVLVRGTSGIGARSEAEAVDRRKLR